MIANLTPVLNQVLKNYETEENILSFAEALKSKSVASHYLRFHKRDINKNKIAHWIVPYFSGWMKKDELFLISPQPVLKKTDEKKVKRGWRIVFKKEGYSVSNVIIRRFYSYDNNVISRNLIHKEIFEKYPEYFSDYPHFLTLGTKKKQVYGEFWEEKYLIDLNVYNQRAVNEPNFNLNIRKILLGVAQGLQALHENSLIHCDIKTPNVFLTEDLKGTISDFDLVTEVNQVKKNRLDYFAWDSLTILKGHATFFCDVYSFAIIMLEIFYGHAIGGYGPLSTRGETVKKLVAIQKNSSPDPAKDLAFGLIQKILLEDLHLVEKIKYTQDFPSLTHGLTSIKECVQVCEEITKITLKGIQ